ncbi:zinc-binding dehydrogenase [Streptomyces cupreus]|uniref:NADPH:quinone reductase n=1 Tax=Streptomyces cupreus TaxID=2759956 RepID=A0A7X1M832_9ACTN|nr:NADPH:quinone reductase [Streptomyces cupreus]
MRAAWYESTGPASAVLRVGEMEDPQPGPGEVRIRVHASGINHGDVIKRQDWTGYGMAWPRVIPHSDGAGVIDAVGEGVPAALVGERVWCYDAQSYRPFGTAAGYVTVPAEKAVHLPDSVSFEQGACLGISGLTAHRALFMDGPLRDAWVLVTGATGAVGRSAVALARRGGARVIATVRRPGPVPGADHVLLADGTLPGRVKELTGGRGVDRVLEVAFGANADIDLEILAVGGVIAAYATDEARPAIPFWQLGYSNVTAHFLGSDDFPAAAKRAATEELSAAAAAADLVHPIARRYPLEDIAAAHEAVETGSAGGRIVVVPGL